MVAEKKDAKRNAKAVKAETEDKLRVKMAAPAKKPEAKKKIPAEAKAEKAVQPEEEAKAEAAPVKPEAKMEDKKEEKKEEKKEDKKEEKKESKVILERMYTIPLRKVKLQRPRTNLAERAVKFVRKTMSKHMKAELANVKIGNDLNEALWCRSIQHVPQRIRVKAQKRENGIVNLSLAK